MTVQWEEAEWPRVVSGHNLQVPGFFSTKYISDAGSPMLYRHGDHGESMPCWICSITQVYIDYGADVLGVCDLCVKVLDALRTDPEFQTPRSATLPTDNKTRYGL